MEYARKELLMRIVITIAIAFGYFTVVSNKIIVENLKAWP
jgi:hypothetical protein